MLTCAPSLIITHSGNSAATSLAYMAHQEINHVEERQNSVISHEDEKIKNKKVNKKDEKVKISSKNKEVNKNAKDKKMNKNAKDEPVNENAKDKPVNENEKQFIIDIDLPNVEILDVEQD